MKKFVFVALFCAVCMMSCNYVNKIKPLEVINNDTVSAIINDIVDSTMIDTITIK